MYIQKKDAIGTKRTVIQKITFPLFLLCFIIISLPVFPGNNEGQVMIEDHSSTMIIAIKLENGIPEIDSIVVTPVSSINHRPRTRQIAELSGMNRENIDSPQLLLKDSSGNVLYQSLFHFPVLQTIPPDIYLTKEKPSPDVLPIEKPVTYLIMPYFKDAQVAEIVKPGKTSPLSIQMLDKDHIEFDNSPRIQSSTTSPVNEAASKLNILIMASGYTAANMSEFNQKAESIKNLILSKEPFHSYSSFINFNFYGNLSYLGCAPGCSGIDRLICCDMYSVLSSATYSGYAFDEILVVHRTNTYCGGGYRDDGIGYKTNSQTSYCVFYSGPDVASIALHEFGHSFGNLCDEYTYGSEGYSYSPCVNCKDSCNSWSAVDGGCNLSCDAMKDYFRPTDSVMLTHYIEEYNRASIEAQYFPDGLEKRLLYFISGGTQSITICGMIGTGIGTGIEGVLVKAEGNDSITQKVTTASSGAYRFSVPPGWTGKISASKTGYIFTPASRSYSSISSDMTTENFTGTINLEASHITVDRAHLYFEATTAGITSPKQTIFIGSTGKSQSNWTISDNASWLLCSPLTGTGAGSVDVSVNIHLETAGTYTGTITITDPNADNSPQTVTVELKVVDPVNAAIPFGELATPGDGVTVRGSVPITGWALDDIGIAKVEIFNGDTYLGDAVFVEGQRPDVEAAYPGYPFNYKAGWGYMLLTNFLPNGGNGTYTINARATDLEGHVVNLGSKTITCDNAHAVNPFGAIDTPAQGGKASGSNYVVFGWALTPMPNFIPTDGSSIFVWVDGVLVGNPTYNTYRSDIANLFPGYSNSNGAVGYYYLDTTGYSNGVHTIQWTVTDSAGNSDGIGSRYFSILNTSGDVKKDKNELLEGREAYNLNRSLNRSSNKVMNVGMEAGKIPVDNSGPILCRSGYSSNSGLVKIHPGASGVIDVNIEELERIEIRFFDGKGEKPVHKDRANGIINLTKLPIGSTLDNGKGIFYWSPGPGFCGDYELRFLDTEVNKQRVVNVHIAPKFSRSESDSAKITAHNLSR